MRERAGECRALQADPGARLSVSEVPAPPVARHGRRNDGCRRRILAQLTADKKAALLGAVVPHAAAIGAWLHGHPGEAMPAKAAAFPHLLMRQKEMAG